MEECGEPWQLEPGVGALADALRGVRDHPEEGRSLLATLPAHGGLRGEVERLRALLG